ncbi:MAG: hypothetical protein HY872_08315 [Chloroflexi bacterium]|nr:hypothetical protein [Chloroflexota bacterium]MBI5829815.1 hypothetical protein [Chloroflexota bacterium]
MSNESIADVPEWLWRTARRGFVAVVLAIAAVTLAVALGVADPKPHGTLQWEDHFADAVGRWQTFGSATPAPGGLTVSLGQTGEAGGAVAQGDPVAPFTFEAAGFQSAGAAGAAYGIVFGYRSATDYSAVLLNNNGYVEVVTAGGKEWMPFQQWPNILLGAEANRLRVDVAGGVGLIRINDEVLMRVPVGEGAVGVLARATAPGQVVRFGWAKLWR